MPPTFLLGGATSDLGRGCKGGTPAVRLVWHLDSAVMSLLEGLSFLVYGKEVHVYDGEFRIWSKTAYESPFLRKCLNCTMFLKKCVLNNP